MSKHKFTLIEMLVVITIIAILAGFIGSAAMNSIRTGKIAACGNNLRNHGLAIEMYRNANNMFYPPWLSAASDEQKELFLCPLDDSGGEEGGRPNWATAENQYPEANDLPSGDFIGIDEAQYSSSSYQRSAEVEAMRSSEIDKCSYLYEFNAAPCSWINASNASKYGVSVGESWQKVKSQEARLYPEKKGVIPVSRCFFHIERHQDGGFKDTIDRVLNLRISGEVNQSPTDNWWVISQ